MNEILIQLIYLHSNVYESVGVCKSSLTFENLKNYCVISETNFQSTIKESLFQIIRIFKNNKQKIFSFSSKFSSISSSPRITKYNYGSDIAASTVCTDNNHISNKQLSSENNNKNNTQNNNNNNNNNFNNSINPSQQYQLIWLNKITENRTKFFWLFMLLKELSLIDRNKNIIKLRHFS